MATEIERKFLVLTRIDPATLSGKVEPIDQGYLSSGDITVRVRTKGDRAFLTIKYGKKMTTGGAISVSEFEYQIPVSDAKQLLDAATYRLQKTRYTLDSGIEIDIFHGRHTGLILAEYECEEGSIPTPPEGIRWREVSHDSRYSNSWISRNGIPPV